MIVETKNLTGPALDWAVAKCEQKPLVFRGRKWPTDGTATVEYAPWAVHPVVNGSGQFVASLCNSTYSPSTDWNQGGPIIEREDIAMWPDQEGGWFASTDQGKSMDYHGETALIAAMRCYVASKLGDTVDISEELL